MTHIRTISSRPSAGQVIAADIAAYGRQYDIRTYTEDHVITALIGADIDPRRLPYTPYELMKAVMVDHCLRALKQ